MMISVTREQWMAKVPVARAIGWLITLLGSVVLICVLYGLFAGREFGSVPAALALLIIGSTTLAVTLHLPENDRQVKQRIIILGTVISIVILMFPFGLA